MSSTTGHSTLFPDYLQQPCGSFTPTYSTSFIPFHDFLPSGSYTPISSGSQPATSSSTEFSQPFSVDAQIMNAPLPSDALDLDWLIPILQLQPPANPQLASSNPQGRINFLQAPSCQFDSSLNNVIYDTFACGPSSEISSAPSSTGLSNTVPCSPGSELLYPSPDQEADIDRSVADDEEHVSPSHPQAGPIRRPRSQTARDPLYSTGRYTCRYHGCPWRFRNARMCNRHEQTHNEANAYFCCNPRCSTNTGKRKAGFLRRDSIRRHYAKKSPDDPCVVMAKSLGWTGELIYEEEMFRMPPTPAF